MSITIVIADIMYPSNILIIFSLLIRLYSFCYFHKHFSLDYLVGFDKAKGAHKTFLVLYIIKGKHDVRLGF